MRLGKLLNIIIAVLLFVILGFWGYYFYSRDNQGIGTQIDIGEGGLIFPPLDSNFTFETIYGKSIKVGAEDRRMVVDGFQGKIVFLKIFRVGVVNIVKKRYLNWVSFLKRPREALGGTSPLEELRLGLFGGLPNKKTKKGRGGSQRGGYSRIGGLLGILNLFFIWLDRGYPKHQGPGKEFPLNWEGLISFGRKV